MKKAMMIMVLGLTAAAFSAPAYAAPNKVSCAACHKGSEDSVGPALNKVVAAYGSVDKVFAFLDSDAPLTPKVKGFEKKVMVMKGQLKRYRAFDDATKAEARAWFEEQLK